MKVKMILPALTEATSPFWRPIKYSLFPPLGLATLAGYLGDADDVEIQDEHVEKLDLDDTPDLGVGFRDPRETRRNDAAAAGDDSQRVRNARASRGWRFPRRARGGARRAAPLLNS
jgi:hypothetical protein